MSVKIMGLVWDCALENPTERFVLLAYADHADHTGSGIFPAVSTVAKKTGYSDRSVQRATQSLIDKGILCTDGRSKYGTNLYRIDVQALVEYIPPQVGVTDCHPPDLSPSRGDTVSPGDRQSPGGVTDSHRGGDSVSPRGDSVSPKPSLTVIKPSKEKKEGISVSSKFTQAETANAVNQFGNNGARQANLLYCTITGQMSIPTTAQSALEDLENILDYYDHDQKRAVDAGKPVFAEWCNTVAKSGRKYSAINPGWISKWLERIAPRPQIDTVDSIAQRVAKDLRLRK